ncbi:MAG: hypothetical protein HY791_28710 [Deltaproteobacteria bacterium]|nr:hypothetical protein [Deltaproteobacteria bacterium]
MELDPANGPLLRQLAEQARTARAHGRAPFIDLTADWCPPARAIKESLAHPLMTDAFAGTHVVLASIDDFSEELQAGPYRFTKIPMFLPFDESGQPIGDPIDGGAWGEDTPENMARALRPFFRSHGATSVAPPPRPSLKSAVTMAVAGLVLLALATWLRR